MIREFSKNKKLFMVVCANWEGVVEAVDSKEAAALSLEQADNIYGKNLKLSPTMSIYNISNSYEDNIASNDVSFIYTPDVLANAGMHSLSKKYNFLIEAQGKGRSGGDEFID
jgi:hypothetical protein